LQTFLQEELAFLSTDRSHPVAEHSAHAMHSTESDMMLEAVEQVVEAARNADKYLRANVVVRKRPRDSVS